MDEKQGMELTEGSSYKITSLGGRDAALETEGIFKGFISIGVDEIGLLMELGSAHGAMAGKIRIVPLHVLLAIDVLEVKPTEKKDEDKKTSHYYG